MTKHERLLALEAALYACEGCGLPSEATAALTNFLDDYYCEHYSNAPLNVFLHDQLAAVKKLSESPEVFGCK